MKSACLLLLSALPAHAMTATGPADCLADLQALEGGLVNLIALPPGTITDFLAKGGAPTFADGDCMLSDLFLPVQQFSGMDHGFSLGRLRWQAEWADATRLMPPTRLSIRVENLLQVFTPSPDMPLEPGDFRLLTAYQTQVLAELAPYRLALDLTYDPAAQSLDVTNLSAHRGDWDGAVFSARIADADLAALFAPNAGSLPLLDGMAGASLHHADLRLTNLGLFEGIFSGWVGMIYPALGDTPEDAVDRARTIAAEQLAQIPPSLIDSDSRAALTAVLDSIPHPLGRLRVTLDAPDGIAPARLAAATAMIEQPGWADIEGMLNGASLIARWTPITPKPQLPPEVE